MECAIVQTRLDRGAIEPSQSSWASPLLLVTKKGGCIHFCMDYGKVNYVTRRDAYQLPWIDNALNALSGSQYFSTHDLYSGYWQVKMDPKDIDKDVCYPPRPLPVYSDAVWALQCPGHVRAVHGAQLTGLNWEICLIYLDDVIIYGGNLYNVLGRLKQVWQRIRDLHLRKAQTFQVLPNARQDALPGALRITLQSRIGPRLTLLKT